MDNESINWALAGLPRVHGIDALMIKVSQTKLIETVEAMRVSLYDQWPCLIRPALPCTCP